MATTKKAVAAPTPEQIAAWQEALAPLQDKLRAEHGDFWTWTTGGCFAFAEAFQRAFGGELWGDCRYDTQGKDWPVDHAVVKIGDAFYDHDGLFEPPKGSRTRRMLPESDDRIAWFRDEFLSEADMKLLKKTLSDVRASAAPAPEARRRASPSATL